jgi:uncharacterized protein
MKQFQQTQLAFAQYLRDPLTFPAPVDVEERRAVIYRDLIFNNIEGFIAGAFPVLKSLMDAAEWRALIRGFIRDHPCETPYFLQISQEFIAYLMADNLAQGEHLPFMLELAHYEWVELALDVAEANLPEAGELPHEPLAAIAQVSPLVMGLTYQYPVHKIAPSFQPQTPTPCSLLVYRNRADQVHFMEVNALTLRLLYLLQTEPPMALSSFFDRIALELQHPQPKLLQQEGLVLVKELFHLSVISHFA